MLLIALAATAAAAAAVPKDWLTNDRDTPSRLRSGIVLGVELGAELAAADGYPNDATQIGDPRYHSASGLLAGPSETLLLMGALADSLSFGFWFSHAALENSRWRSNGNGGGLRVELFPLITLFPALSRMAVFGQFGIGGSNLISKMPNVPESSGTQSFVGAGAFYEWSFGSVFGGHFGAGPSLEYDAIFSQPFERHGLLASARLVFYGGP